jgi:hypothetical protein
MSHSPLKVNRRLGRTCGLHLQGQGINQAELASSFMLISLLGLLFNTEDKGDMFNRNFG